MLTAQSMSLVLLRPKSSAAWIMQSVTLWKQIAQANLDRLNVVS